MPDITERFLIFIKSSFDTQTKEKLFAYIWEQYSRRITFYISRYVPYSHPFFEDLFQDIMLKVYTHLDTYRPRHSFKAWLYKIVRNHCLNFLYSKHEQMHGRAVALEDVVSLVDGDTPEKNMLSKEGHVKIGEYLNHLEIVDREIAFLRFFENLKYREISDIMKININTVRTKIRTMRLELINKVGG